MGKTADDVAKRFNLASRPDDLRENYNVSPSQIMPVVTEDDSGRRQLELMRWGIPRKLFLNGQSVEKELINTRADKAFGRFWRRTVTGQRCLVPATGFYEWKKSAGGKVPFFIHPKQLDLYAFAGIWDSWESEDKQKVKVYSIMTTEPNKEMKAVHNRMPVILHPADEDSWIKPSNDKPETLGELLLPFEDGGLDIYEVSRAVNSPRNNQKSLLAPVATQ